MLYLLSKLIPVPMSSTYGVVQNGEVAHREHASWWQWRDRIFQHRTTRLA